MRLIDSMNWMTQNHFLASPMHLDWICCCCCSCRSNVIFPSGKIPYNCSIIVLPTVADIHGRILLERIQPEGCLKYESKSLILNLFQFDMLFICLLFPWFFLATSPCCHPPFRSQAPDILVAKAIDSPLLG